jgi:hypothetical protein
MIRDEHPYKCKRLPSDFASLQIVHMLRAPPRTHWFADRVLALPGQKLQQPAAVKDTFAADSRSCSKNTV